MERTEIQSLGEFGLIERLTRDTKTYHTTTVKGIGDDAAVIRHGDYLQVITSDMLLEGIHFDLAFSPLKHLGYKAIAVNVSDVAAMNAVPQQITVNIGVSNRFSVEALEQLYEGIHSACENYRVDLAGGDTTSSRSGLVISVTATGTTTEKQIAYRGGASEGDILCVTGDLGGAYLGLQVLEREKQVLQSDPDMQPKMEAYDYLLQRQLRPEARMDIVHEFRELGIVPTSMIDVSDGLASETLHLCKASGLSAVIYEEKIPVHQQSYNLATSEFKLPPTTCALNGGEDYELLFTIKQADFEKIKLHDDISFVGYMAAAGQKNLLVTRGGQQAELTAQGWQHFE